MLVKVAFVELNEFTVSDCPDKLLTNINPQLKFVIVKLVTVMFVNVKLDPVMLVTVVLVAFKNVNVAF